MIGERIKEHREAAGMTQAELAGKMFVTQPMVAAVEAGTKLPTVGMVKIAAETFGCTTDELIFGKRESA